MSIFPLSLPAVLHPPPRLLRFCACSQALCTARSPPPPPARCPFSVPSAGRGLPLSSAHPAGSGAGAGLLGGVPACRGAHRNPLLPWPPPTPAVASVWDRTLWTLWGPLRSSDGFLSAGTLQPPAWPEAPALSAQPGDALSSGQAPPLCTAAHKPLHAASWASWRAHHIPSRSLGQNSPALPVCSS